ncbi:MAG: hypothetical protein AAF333_02470 [Planctomycetota bacterium]
MGITKRVGGGLAVCAGLSIVGTSGAQNLGTVATQGSSFFEPWATTALGQVEDNAAGDGGFTLFANNPEGYAGAQGLISIQGTRGTFLNPTSGTLKQGQVTVQYCVLSVDQVEPGSDLTGHGILGSYGVTDWLEIGFFHNAAEIRALDEIVAVTGPTVRLRLFQEDLDGWIPEISVGGLWFDGDASDDALARQEAYVVGSKYFAIDEDGWVQGARVHLGVRQVWRSDAPVGTAANATVGTFAGELLLPYGFSFIGEFNTQADDIGPRTPYAYGVQFKPVGGVLGLSVAQLQNGGTNRNGVYVGIGGSLEF